MNNTLTSRVSKIDKKHVTAMATFAINNIPSTDQFTLNKFLELMNTTGSFGSVTAEQLLETMRLMMKYVPGTCNQSLFVLVELLGVHLLIDVKPAELPQPDPVPAIRAGSHETRSDSKAVVYHQSLPLFQNFARFLNLL